MPARAAAGWRNVLVPNLFVFHQHGGTFEGTERAALLDANLRLLHRRWPAYYRELAAFRRRDPWAIRRSAAILALATAPEARPEFALDPHVPDAQTDRRVEEALATQRGFARVRAAGPDGPLVLEAGRGGWLTTVRLTDAGTEPDPRTAQRSWLEADLMRRVAPEWTPDAG